MTPNPIARLVSKAAPASFRANAVPASGPASGESIFVKRSFFPAVFPAVFRAGVPAAAMLLALSACAPGYYRHLPSGPAAYKSIPPEAGAADRKAFLIAPGDQLTLKVMGEDDLSLDKVVVDNSGAIQVPLAGEVMVEGHSPGEVTKTIADLLRTKGLRNPQVALNISEPVSRTVSVEGQVTKAGVYAITPDTTLLSAVALAESPTRVAKLDDVVVLRIRNGERLAARFDLDRIRHGLDEDPQILPGDTVVVGFSQVKSGYRDLLQASNLIYNLFTRF